MSSKVFSLNVNEESYKNVNNPTYKKRKKESLPVLCETNNVNNLILLESCNGTLHSVPIVALATISPVFEILCKLATTKAKQLRRDKKLNGITPSDIGVKGNAYGDDKYIPILQLKNVPDCVIQNFIKQSHKLPLEITHENCQSLVIYANQFHIQDILNQCGNYLLNAIEPENALGIYKLCKKSGMKSTTDLVRKYILCQFMSVRSSLEFKQLEEHDMIDLLSDDELNVKNEQIVFESLINWIHSCPKERKSLCANLIKSVRLGLLSFEYCSKTLMTNPYYLEALRSDFSRNYMLEAQKYAKNLQTNNTESNDTSFNFTYSRPRIPYEIIFAMGGWSTGSTTNFMETYDARTDRWFICSDTNLTTVRPAYHGMVYVNSLIYVIGGYDGTDYFNMVQKFDAETEEWSLAAPMHKPRCYVSVTVCKGQIYALGGFNGISRLSCGERYDPARNQWTMLPGNMHRERSDACAATLKDKVFIVGGFNGQDISNTAEYFDTNTEQWVLIKEMLSPRTGVRCVIHKNLLYVVGGFNGTQRLHSGECYDPVTDEWREIANMICPRSNFTLLQMEGTLYAIGGFNGNTTISLMEKYDPEENRWSTCSNMNIRRSALGACVVYGLKNARQYTYHGQVGLETHL